jgi:hypothetical protein
MKDVSRHCAANLAPLRDHGAVFVSFPVDLPMVDRLDDFKRYSLALGPMVNYLKKWQGGQVEFSLRWLHEFDVKNRMQGNLALLSATISLRNT